MKRRQNEKTRFISVGVFLSLLILGDVALGKLPMLSPSAHTSPQTISHNGFVIAIVNKGTCAKQDEIFNFGCSSYSVVTSIQPCKGCITDEMTYFNPLSIVAPHSHAVTFTCDEFTESWIYVGSTGQGNPQFQCADMSDRPQNRL